MIGLQNDINSKLKDLAYDSFGSNNPPKLTLNSLERYYFKTPSDGGTGTQQKGLILFDLIALNTTNLPIVIFVQKIKKSPIKRRFLYHKSNTNTKLTFE